MDNLNRRQSFTERYASGQIPWDDADPPPELIELAKHLKPGKALDLGSGYGRTSIYLAKKGWQVDGIEFISQAVEESQGRAHKAGVDQLTRFFLGDVTNLDMLQGPYDLAVDIGCMHTLTKPELETYRDELKRLLHRGAIYLLFAHLRDLEDSSEDATRWIEEGTLLSIFSDGFSLTDSVHGITIVAENPPWSSAWYYFQRL
ncbi:MAG: SAM-dependent methyltransferase [Anaerolineales bacterium]|jgi:cyclopropane fatty-acyl-phospholipid synthase-like methyltransferase